MDVPEVGEPPRFLLLLPPVSSPRDSAALKVAYGETLSQVLKEVALQSADHAKAAVLEIALACPHLVGTQQTARSALYDETQSLVAGVYKLITVAAAQDDINIEDADGVDPRVILVAWSADASDDEVASSPYGPVINLQTLAKSARQWQYAFGVESDAGESMVRAFVELKGRDIQADRVTSQTSSKIGAAAEHGSSKTAPTQLTHQKHYDVAVGGTWDHLHIGHKLLITMTVFAVDVRDASEKRSATIGITGDQLLVNKKHASLVESWVDRQKAVATFFNAIIDFSTPATRGQRHASIQDDPGPNGKSIDIHYPSGLIVKCTEIQDPFGPTITEETISALVLSAETRSGGKAVNEKRREQGWKELDLFEVDVLDADDDSTGGTTKEGFESKISSTAIREKLARKGKM
ncbi:Putative rossmann-like alpha/beta/alpha sandwich protein [Septoria linicola]|uniref:Rossmann-like alpha/beta/alpha sandwich protein n=1 Tax=Septoria linicola TaxID=215465 RepID=A0A9Q9EEN8_9PEZI|nr:putative rossmann-like alpha/beta/alpha sandwich protein [Septoria linicola]USW47114.1 Putative rossmann-like alpha/beta/alpha sandwich protein [Septoria linicola]